MKITEITPTESYLIVRGEGPFEPRVALQRFHEIVEASASYKLPRVLVDLRKMEGEPGILSLYDIGVKVAERAGGITHLAVIACPEHILPDRFWQTVVRNRGLNVMVFADEAEAIAFLTVQLQRREPVFQSDQRH